ncbi:MAG TPA: ATP-binding protein [Opitutus sp.]|nr:ATP-binding protein [Opitutus sp.]
MNPPERHGDSPRLPGSWDDSAARERLIAAQRREGFGLIAGNAIHNFNNILAGILGCGELAQDDIPAGSPGLEHVARIMTSARQSADFCRQLLTYSSQEEPVSGGYSLNNVVHGHEHLLRIGVRSRMRLVFELDDTAPAATGDPAQIAHVLVNLVVNAADAITAGSGSGEIIVATGRVPAADGSARRVFLEVRDDGPGIVPEDRERLFTPYFTTRPNRCGLGLAVAAWLAEANGGAITVTSEPGRGASFRVLLPAAD